jgi:hypothetical protein
MKPLDLALAACTFAAPGLAQIQTAKLQAFDSAQFQSFGTAVAADNGWLVVGVRQDSQIASTAGAAYSYQRSGGAWNFVEKFFSSDIQQGDGFGYSVVMDGATCVIGATYEDPNGVFAAGSVYVFERIGANWIQTQKLGATPAIPNANFGWSIDLDDDRMVVGARGESSRGAAYVFERSAGVWSQTARLQASDVALFDFFGGAVAVEDNTVFVGSTADGPGATDQGAVYVFEFNGVQWLELAKLHASDPQSLSGFGSKLGVRGGTAFIGAHNHAHAGVGGSGSSYVFGDSGATWSETQELQQHAPGIGLLFGVGIRLSDSFAVIGASRDPNNLSGGGATYLFSRGFAGWSELARMSANDALPSDGFGGALAVDDSTVVVGVPGRRGLRLRVLPRRAPIRLVHERRTVREPRQERGLHEFDRRGRDARSGGFEQRRARRFALRSAQAPAEQERGPVHGRRRRPDGARRWTARRRGREHGALPLRRRAIERRGRGAARQRHHA